MDSNWCFTNETFWSLAEFAPKVEAVSYKHTGSVQQAHVASLPQGSLCKMINLRSLSVQSAAFTQGYFIQLLPQLHTLRLLDCPNFDVETLVEALQRLRRSKSLTTLDISGVPRVSSFNKWLLCSLCPNLQKAVSNAVMGDFIAEQCFMDCEKLHTLTAGLFSAPSTSGLSCADASLKSHLADAYVQQFKCTVTKEAIYWNNS